MTIFNFRWKHNNWGTKITIPTTKVVPYPLSVYLTYAICGGFLVEFMKSLVLDIVPQH